MRVLVTGYDGFIGRHVMQALRAEQMEPVPFRGDVREPKDWALYRDADVVIHLAAKVGTGESMYRPVSYCTSNVVGTAQMLEALADSPVRRIVLASSSAVYGSGECLGERDRCEPVSIYGISKLAQEQMVLRWAEATGRSAAALRVFSAYGPGQALDNPYSGLVGIMAGALLAGESPQVFEDGRQTRDLIHVSDVAGAFVTAAFGHFEGPLNIGTGDATTVSDLVAILRGHLGGLTAPQPVFLGTRRAGDVRHAVADISKARSLGITPTVGLERGLYELCRWAKAQPPVRSEQGRAVSELLQRGLVA